MHVGLSHYADMSEILSQAEIEALLGSLQSGEDAGVASAAAVARGNQSPVRPGISAPAAYEVYDFKRSDKFSKEQLRTLQMLHETFARFASSQLSGYLRSQVNIDLISLEQVPYDEFLRSVGESVFLITSLPPLSGQAVMELEFGLVFTMIDRLLGGPGKSISRTTLTEIERPLVRQIVERTFHALKSAWEGIVMVNPGIEGMEISSQFVQIAPPSDIVVTILFEVRLGSTRGAMSLCIPYLVLKPITTKLSAQKWFVSSNRKHSPSQRKLLTQQVQQTSVDCGVKLGATRLAVRDFLDLAPGDVLPLDQRTDRSLSFLVEDIPKFLGKPATQGNKLVFTIADSIHD